MPYYLVTPEDRQRWTNTLAITAVSLYGEEFERESVRRVFVDFVNRKVCVTGEPDHTYTFEDLGVTDVTHL
jgi:hypothetical protein